MVGSGKNYRVNWRSRVRPGSAEAYALATFLVMISSLMRWGMGLLTADVQGFATYYPAVLFAHLRYCIRRSYKLVGIPASVFGIFTPLFGTSTQPTKLSNRLSAYCVGGRTLSQAYEGSRR